MVERCTGVTMGSEGAEGQRQVRKMYWDVEMTSRDEFEPPK